MVLLKVKEIIGSNYAVAPDSGNDLYMLLKEKLQEKKEVELSFKNIDQMTTAFLNNGIAKLYNDFTSYELNTYLKIIDINPLDTYLLKKVISRAKLKLENDLIENINGEFGND